MSAVPMLVLQLGFDSPQPYLGGLVYSALVDTSEKHLARFVLERTCVWQHDINLPTPLFEYRLNLAFDFIWWLLVWPPFCSPCKAIPFVHTISAADHKTTSSAEIIYFPIDGKQNVWVLQLYPNLAAWYVSIWYPISGLGRCSWLPWMQKIVHGSKLRYFFLSSSRQSPK